MPAEPLDLVVGLVEGLPVDELVSAVALKEESGPDAFGGFNLGEPFRLLAGACQRQRWPNVEPAVLLAVKNAQQPFDAGRLPAGHELAYLELTRT